MLNFTKYLLVVFLFAIACQPESKEGEESKRKVKNGIVEQFYPDGSIKNKIPVKNGKRHGRAQSFYKDGTLRQEIDYVNNVKHGEVITYYQNGKKYQVTPYVNGKIEGIRKKYRQNGKLVAEVPYSDGEVCAGLKEYLLNGEEKTGYPELIIKAENNLLKNGTYVLKLSASNGSKDVEYFNGKLTEGGCIPHYLSPIGPVEGGTAEVIYKLPQGSYVMEELNFIAKIKTRLGNYFITEKSHYLAVEHR